MPTPSDNLMMDICCLATAFAPYKVHQDDETKSWTVSFQNGDLFLDIYIYPNMTLDMVVEKGIGDIYSVLLDKTNVTIVQVQQAIRSLKVGLVDFGD